MNTVWVSSRNAVLLRFAVLAIFCSVVTFLLGKDSNWDIFNYHLYAPHAFWTQDLQTDFMAAGAQRYLNPIGYLPFYWMIQAGWHSLAIAIILTVFHSLALLILWEMCARYIFRNDSQPGLLASLSVALAALSPVFLGMLGGTYLDPPMLVFVFGGLLLLCRALERPTPSLLLPLLAGGLFGIAAALKLTNVIFVASAGVAILAAMRFKATGWMTASCFVVGAMIGALLAGGWWAFLLYREFGNPFFPLFNEFFHSPDFPSVRLSLVRFMPVTVMDALTFPINMASSRKWVYVERTAADIRFLFLVVFTLLLLLSKLVRSRKTMLQAATLSECPQRVSVKMIIVFFVVSFALWLATSGNGRYALPVLLLVAPVVILAIREVVKVRSWFLGTAMLILALQMTVVLLAESPRWDVGEWTKNWIDVEVPAKLRDNHYGYLTEGNNSNSFVALSLHPASRLVSMIGIFPLSKEGPGGERLRTFIASYTGKLRTLSQLEFPLGQTPLGETDFGQHTRNIDVRYALWDLRVDATDCQQIKYGVRSENFAILISCALVPGNPQHATMLPEWKRATSVMEQIEIACPALFSPKGGYTTKLGFAWYRHYPNTDVRLRILSGHAFFFARRFWTLRCRHGRYRRLGAWYLKMELRRPTTALEMTCIAVRDKIFRRQSDNGTSMPLCSGSRSGSYF